MGGPIAGKPGFAYSDALKGVGGNWSWEQYVPMARQSEEVRAR
jgi:hypothetical protein